LRHGREALGSSDPRPIVDHDGCAYLRAADIERENRPC
jgi:hypothetical protein